MPFSIQIHRTIQLSVPLTMEYEYQELMQLLDGRPFDSVAINKHDLSARWYSEVDNPADYWKWGTSYLRGIIEGKMNARYPNDMLAWDQSVWDELDKDSHIELWFISHPTTPGSWIIGCYPRSFARGHRNGTRAFVSKDATVQVNAFVSLDWSQVISGKMQDAILMDPTSWTCGWMSVLGESSGYPAWPVSDLAKLVEQKTTNKYPTDLFAWNGEMWTHFQESPQLMLMFCQSLSGDGKYTVLAYPLQDGSELFKTAQPI